jgi:hypothetical protein
VKKEAFSNSLLFGLGKRTWHLRIFVKITKLSLQQVGKTTWQIWILMMLSDGGLCIFATRSENFATLTKLPRNFANLLEAIFYSFVKNLRIPSTFNQI